MTGHITVVKVNVREQLLDTGLRVLHERGFNATSVQDITEAAGVPKGSFYNHFESKEDLGAEVVSRYLESSNKTQAVLRDPKLSPYARLRKYFEGLVQVAEKKEFCGGCLLGNFAAELSEQSEMIRARVSKEFSTWSAMIANVIAEAQTEGKISKDLPASTLAAFVLNGWEGALVRARVDKSKAPLEQFVKVTFAKTLAPS
jgi:TetR/AcrR family transcriptional regulator, transcriptional repressor for nem operon